jgi:hypothetical protein
MHSASVTEPDHWRRRTLDKEISDTDLKRLFEEKVQGEVNRVKPDFGPRVFKTYKDVTYETFKNPESRKLFDQQSCPQSA